VKPKPAVKLGGASCSSARPNDGRVEECAAWCKPEAQLDHCDWCKCKACGPCEGKGAAAAAVRASLGGDFAASPLPPRAYAPPATAVHTGASANLVVFAASGAVAGLVLLVLGAVCALCAQQLFARRGRRGARGARSDSPLLPVQVEVNGATQILAVDLQGARTIRTLREAIAEAYAEVTGCQIVPKTMHIELEDADGRFSQVDEAKPPKSGRLATARSLYVTAARSTAAAGFRH